MAEKIKLEIVEVRSNNSSGVYTKYIEKDRGPGNELSSLT